MDLPSLSFLHIESTLATQRCLGLQRHEINVSGVAVVNHHHHQQLTENRRLFLTVLIFELELNVTTEILFYIISLGLSHLGLETRQ